MKAEAALEKSLRSDWWLLLPYLLALLVGLAVAWSDRLVTAPDFARALSAGDIGGQGACGERRNQ